MGRRRRPMESTRQPRAIYRLDIQREIVGILPARYVPC